MKCSQYLHILIVQQINYHISGKDESEVIRGVFLASNAFFWNIQKQREIDYERIFMPFNEKFHLTRKIGHKEEETRQHVLKMNETVLLS